MTARQMLACMDSRELAERMIMANLDHWEKKVRDSDKARSNELIQALFSKALAKGSLKNGEQA